MLQVGHAPVTLQPATAVTQTGFTSMAQDTTTSTVFHVPKVHTRPDDFWIKDEMQGE